MAVSLEDIETEIQAKLEKLNFRQRKFVLAYKNGAKTQADAARAAGYSARVADKNATRVYNSTKHVIALVRKQQALEQGEPISAHRSRLLQLFDLTSDNNADTWEPRTAHSISRTLLELDGYIKGDAKSSAEISIKIVDPVAGITIDHQSDQSLSEDGDSKAVQALPNK